MDDNNNALMNQLQINELIGVIENNIIQPITLNGTIKIYPSSDFNASTANIALRDTVNNTTFNHFYSYNNELYFGSDDNEKLIITTDNVISEVNNVYYPSTTSNLIVSNISVLGGSENTEYGHINFEENGGAGFRFNKSSNTIEYRTLNTDSWSSIASGGLDTTITSPQNNDILQYSSGTSKWVNNDNITLGGTLTLGGDVTGGSNLINFSNNYGLGDSNGDEVLVVGADTTPVNHIKITNADTSVNPIISSVGDDTNIGLTVQSKGSGDVLLEGNSASVTIGSNNILLQPTTKVDIDGYIVSSTSSVSTGSWTTGIGNSIALSITTDILVINMVGKGAGDYYCSISSGESGQHLHIFYYNETGNSITVRVSFGSNELVIGSGLASTIKFSNTGESSSLVYINESIGKWFVKNVGAIIE